MPLEGYDSANYVKSNYGKLKELIEEMKSGLLIDLIRRFQIRAGVKEDKSREYVVASASEGWIEVTNDGKVLDALQISAALKYLKPSSFVSKLGMEKSGNSAANKTEPKFSMEKRIPKEPADFDLDSPTPFTDYAKRKKLEELRQKLSAAKFQVELRSD